MSDERKQRLALGLRKNQGQLRMQEFVSDVAQALGRPADTIRVTDLETYDQLISAAFDGALREECGPVFDSSWFPEQIDDARGVLETLKQHVPDEPMVLFRGLSNYCGAVETSSHEVLERAFQLTSFDHEEAFTVNLAGTAGIWLEYGIYQAPVLGSGKSPGYRLRIWGEDWLRAIERFRESPE